MKILKAKENFAGNYCHNILRLSDVWPNFFSAHLKRNMVIINKLVYTSCLTSYQRLKTLDRRKLGNIRKISKLNGIIA